MRQFQQYEIWSMQEGRWELVAAFLDLQTAMAVARARGRSVRLVHATYEDGVQVDSETVVGIGETKPQLADY